MIITKANGEWRNIKNDSGWQVATPTAPSDNNDLITSVEPTQSHAEIETGVSEVDVKVEVRDVISSPSISGYEPDGYSSFCSSRGSSDYGLMPFYRSEHEFEARNTLLVRSINAFEAHGNASEVVSCAAGMVKDLSKFVCDKFRANPRDRIISNTWRGFSDWYWGRRVSQRNEMKALGLMDEIDEPEKVNSHARSRRSTLMEVVAQVKNSKSFSPIPTPADRIVAKMTAYQIMKDDKKMTEVQIMKVINQVVVMVLTPTQDDVDMYEILSSNAVQQRVKEYNMQKYTRGDRTLGNVFGTRIYGPRPDKA